MLHWNLPSGAMAKTQLSAYRGPGCDPCTQPNEASPTALAIRHCQRPDDLPKATRGA